MVTGRLPDAIEALRLIYTDLIKEHCAPLAPTGALPACREPVSEENPCLQVSPASAEGVCVKLYLRMTKHSHMPNDVNHALSDVMTQQGQQQRPDAARPLRNSTADESHHLLQVNLIMPSMVCGLIIGKQGQTIKTLQDLSAADIK